MSLHRLALFVVCLLAFPSCIPVAEATTTATQTRVLGTTITSTDPTVTLVDRNDDFPMALPCSDEPNDCTLRSAITLANNNPNPTTIMFASDYRIVLTQPLPTLTANNLKIQTQIGQEVHVNGNGLPSNVFRITGSGTTIDGLRIYGAGTDFSNIWIGETAVDITVANSIIGDDDAPMGDCGLSDFSYGGIYIDARQANNQTRVWIYNNIIECHKGVPGDGITVLTSGVFIGENNLGETGTMQKNEIRENNGYAVRLGQHGGNTIRHAIVERNGGTFLVENFNNDLVDNVIR